VRGVDFDVSRMVSQAGMGHCWVWCRGQQPTRPQRISLRCCIALQAIIRTCAAGLPLAIGESLVQVAGPSTKHKTYTNRKGHPVTDCQVVIRYCHTKHMCLCYTPPHQHHGWPC
jgi:hypothetical protein